MPTALWIIIGVSIIIWLFLRSSRSQKAHTVKNDAIEIPIKISVSYSNGPDIFSDIGTDNNIDKDEWEGSFWEASNPIDLKKTLKLEYTDGAGKKSERIVDVRQFDEGLYGGMIIGHCHMRNATRTFRFDRISKCIDMNNGEVISDVKQYLRSTYEKSPEASVDKLMDDEYETLRILLFICKADGQYRKEEKAILRDTCRTLSNDARLTDEMIDKLIAKIEVPTMHAFKMAVSKLDKKETINIDLIAVAHQLVGTQSTVHAVEKEALDYLEKRLTST